MLVLWGCQGLLPGSSCDTGVHMQYVAVPLSQLILCSLAHSVCNLVARRATKGIVSGSLAKCKVVQASLEHMQDSFVIRRRPCCGPCRLGGLTCETWRTNRWPVLHRQAGGCSCLQTLSLAALSFPAPHQVRLGKQGASGDAPKQVTCQSAHGVISYRRVNLGQHRIPVTLYNRPSDACASA